MHFTLHLTTDCNMRCSYCYSPPHSSPVMSEETGRQAMDLGSRMSNGSCGIVFFGGEPLLHKDLIRKLVAYGREQERRQAGRFHFKFTTNGLLLDEGVLDFSLKEDVLIALSFDGIREAHDRHRRMVGGGPSFDVLYPKLKLLLAARPYSSILMVVNPDTVEYLCDSVAFLMDEGYRYLLVSLNYAGNWQEADMKKLSRQYEKLGELYIQWTEAGRKFYLSPFEVKLSSHINKHCYHHERCELAQKQISVDPQGYLFPCVQFTRAKPGSDFCIGHVDSGIDETARQRLYAASLAERQPCAQCTIRERCNHTCGCLNWQTTGTLTEVSPVLCRHEQMLVPIADAIGRRLYKKRNPLFLHKHYNAAYPILSLLEDVYKTGKEENVVSKSPGKGARF
jgi:uncharacterized protein